MSHEAQEYVHPQEVSKRLDHCVWHCAVLRLVIRHFRRLTMPHQQPAQFLTPSSELLDLLSPPSSLPLPHSTIFAPAYRTWLPRRTESPSYYSPNLGNTQHKLGKQEYA